MNDAIVKLIERISGYEILNNFVPGVVFIALVEKLTPFIIWTNNTWVDIVLSYFSGLIIGRIGSLFIEAPLRKHGKLKNVSHAEYVKAESKNATVRELLMINNMYRTYASVGFCLLLTVAFSEIKLHITACPLFKLIFSIIASIMLAILFGLSFVKQTEYLRSRIETVNNEEIAKNQLEEVRKK